MVIVILGILAAMVLPRFIDLQSQAKVSAAKGALGAIRSAIAVSYAQGVALGSTEAEAIPDTITATMFQDNKIPVEPISGTNEVTLVASPEGISATGIGWAYDATNGRAWINDSDYTQY